MSVQAFLFYLLSAVILLSTGIAITRRNLAHAVVYLVISFFGTALVFYLLGAPLLAALEVIIYAGAIMILFLFIVMMIRLERLEKPLLPRGQMIPALVMGVVYLVVGVLLLASSEPGAQEPLPRAVATPSAFGRFLFQQHWLAIEIASLLLLVVLVGALHIGRQRSDNEEPEP